MNRARRTGIVAAARGSRLVMAAAAFLLLVLAAATVNAPEQARAGEPAYSLGPGDVLAISVWGHEELSVKEAEVRPDGVISFPLVGDMRAAGLSPTELRQNLTRALASFVRDPNVTVMVTRFRTVRVQVLGAVGRPGFYELPGNARVADLLAQAGGPVEEADLEKTVLNQLSQEPPAAVGVDLARLLKDGDATLNLGLASGDLLFVPFKQKAVVLGEVRLPGTYTVKEGEHVLDLLARTGGLTVGADPTQAVLTKGAGGSIIIDLARVQQNPAAPENVSVGAGDKLYVPQAREVVVVGQVRSPGMYRLKQNTTTLDALALAGGALGDADLRHVTVTAPAAAGSAAVVTPTAVGAAAGAGQSGTTGRTGIVVDLSFVASAGGDANSVRTESGPLLLGGEVIFVPEADRGVMVLGQVRAPGRYDVKDGARVLDLLAKAGGLAENAGHTATLTRASRKAETNDIDLTALLRRNESAQNLALQPGDVLFVPEGRWQVLVLGEVARPGMYTFKEGDRLLDAIAMAGGATIRADLGKATLTVPNRDGLDGSSGSGVSSGSAGSGQGQTTVPLDLKALIAQKDPAANVKLAGGEVIYVPEGRWQALVLGEVARPGSYTFKEGDRLLDVLAMAGGPTTKADLPAATLTTTAGARPIDLKTLMEQPTTADNPSLAGGETLFVPEARRQVLVLGQVIRPGLYDFKLGDRLLDAIAMAGGVTPAADTRAATMVARDGGMEGAEEVIPLRLDSALRQEDPAANLSLTNQAAIYIPEAKRQILVLGEVARPGLYTFKEGDRLLDAIGMAGGLTDRSDAQRASLISPLAALGQPANLDLKKLMLDPAGDLNAPLKGGETVYVPEAKRQIMVLGEVASPGLYTFKDGARLLDALAMAGGPREAANLAQAALTVPAADGSGAGRTAAVDLASIMAEPSKAENVRLTGGEALYIPRMERQVLILGQVARPGLYTFRDGARLLDAIGLAGGLTDAADASSATLTIPATAIAATADGAPSQPVDLAALEREPHSDLNRRLTGGETVFVPEAKRQVLVLGDVARPGLYTFRDGARLLDAIGLAGGLTDAADASSATLTIPATAAAATASDVPSQPVDLAALEREPHSALNRKLTGGETLFVPEAKRQVLVLGQVARPGVYPFKDGARLLDALALAGGLNSDADGARATLTRRTSSSLPDEIAAVDLDRLLKAEDLASNQTLQNGDTIYVPQAHRRVLVLGQVARPGAYDFKPGARLLDALALAGGSTDKAALESVKVFRTEDVTKATELDLGRDKLLFDGDVKLNPPLDDGQIIYVPEAKEKLDWNKLIQYITGVKLLHDLIKNW